MRANELKRRKDRSLGVVPLRKTGGEVEIFLVKHKKPWWGLPKGHPDAGETDKEAAERELNEETGLRVVEWIDHDPIQEFYTFRHENELVDKEVVYFLAWVDGEVVLQEDEISGGRWFGLNEGYERITYPEGKNLVEIVRKFFGND